MVSKSRVGNCSTFILSRSWQLSSSKMNWQMTIKRFLLVKLNVSFRVQLCSWFVCRCGRCWMFQCSMLQCSMLLSILQSNRHTKCTLAFNALQSFFGPSPHWSLLSFTVSVNFSRRKSTAVYYCTINSSSKSHYYVQQMNNKTKLITMFHADKFAIDIFRPSPVRPTIENYRKMIGRISFDIIDPSNIPLNTKCIRHASNY